MDPATVTGLTALFGIVKEFGPLGLVGIIAFFLVRAWRAGEFLSRGVHDQIVGVLKERLDDWKTRYDSSQEASSGWRTEAERAARTAETAQQQHADMLRQLAEMYRQLDELRDELRDRGLASLPPSSAPPASRNRREGA